MTDNIEKLAAMDDTDKETIRRLAALPALEYDRAREDEAARLGVRVSVLDAEVAAVRRKPDVAGITEDGFAVVDPWPEPIAAALLMDTLVSTVRRFIICREETAVAAALWISMTWLVDRIQIAPLAVITAPEKRCGKSQLLDLIGRLSRRPLPASNISTAAIFRTIEAYNPTLLIDEADTFLRDNEEARGILNSGHSRQSAYVIRLVGDNHEPKKFSTWGAKAVSGIGTLPDTLMDRAIILELRRKLPYEKVERLRHADSEDFNRLAQMLARFSSDAGEAIENARPSIPSELNDRAQDNWEPLLAIADYAGGHWPRLARAAAVRISSEETENLSISAELLADIREILAISRRFPDRISTADLLENLIADAEKPWATYNKGRPMTPRQLGKRLAEYDIKPGTIRFGYETLRGYRRDDFKDAFERYLPLLSPTTSATTLPNVDFSAKQGISCVSDPIHEYPCTTIPATGNSLNGLESFPVTDGAGDEAIDDDLIRVSVKI